VEVGGDAAGKPLDASQERAGLGDQAFAAGDDLVGEVALEVGVDFLGAEVRDVGRQEVQLDPLDAGSDPLPDCLGFVAECPSRNRRTLRPVKCRISLSRNAMHNEASNLPSKTVKYNVPRG
jgi:hypothetical protein